MTIALTTLLALSLAGIGLQTNFDFNTDTETLWTPSSSLAMQHFDWIRDESGFSPPARLLALLFHSSGDNILTSAAIERAFTALDVVRYHPDYDTACAQSDFIFQGVPECPVVGPTRMWSNDVSQFRSEVRTEADVRTTVARTYFPDNLPVPHDTIYGDLQRNRTYASFAQAFTVVVALPEAYEHIKSVELEMVDALLELQKEWQEEEGNPIMLEVVAHGSIPAELIRAVNEDLPLIPLVFVIMSLFTSAVFFKRHPVYSRSGLGASAVVAVMLSIVAGFGLMFVIGVPFTTITQLVPFLVFGIGLDDAFIVLGSYMRTDPAKDPVIRIQETMDDIGLSISLTTLTTATAFILGSFSSVPAVYWLCQYCFPTIFFVFFFQLTFFVACIVLDERRIHAKRQDILICRKVEDTDDRAPPETAHFGTCSPLTQCLSLPRSSLCRRFFLRF